MSKTNQTGCPATEAVANAKEVWEKPWDIGQLSVSKLFVHPIKVGSGCTTVLQLPDLIFILKSSAELSGDIAFGSEVHT